MLWQILEQKKVQMFAIQAFGMYITASLQDCIYSFGGIKMNYCYSEKNANILASACKSSSFQVIS